MSLPLHKKTEETRCRVSYSNVDGKLKCQYKNHYNLTSANHLNEFDEKFWCLFHMPVKSPDGQPSDKSAWHCNYRSALDGFHQELKIIIKLSLDNKEEYVDFSYTVFPNGFLIQEIADVVSRNNMKINFQDCQFYGMLMLRLLFKDYCSFESLDFSNAKFYESVFFCKLWIFSSCFYER